MSSFYTSAYHRRGTASIKPVRLSAKYFILPRYNEPEVKDAAVILAFFNPAQSVRIVQNLMMVKSLLEAAHIPTFIGEIAHKDRPFVLPTSSHVFQFRTESVMFYKENLLAAVERYVPSAYTKIIVLDADVVFENPDWYRVFSAALDTAHVCQGYKYAQYLKLDFSYSEEKVGAIVSPHGHTGFAWGFQRSWFRSPGLFEYALTGGGDTMFYAQIRPSDPRLIFPAYAADFKDHPRTPADTVIGFADLRVFHLPHGSKDNRQYKERHDVLVAKLRELKITRLSDAVERRPHDGMFEWKPVYRETLNALLLAYFRARKDDAVVA